MALKVFLLFLQLAFVVIITLLDYYWTDKRTLEFLNLRVLAIFFAVAIFVMGIWDEKDHRNEKQALLSKISDLKELQSKDMELSHELMRVSGMHTTYPQFSFFRGTSIKTGPAEMLGSTISVLIHNPGDYPIYDLDIHIEEVLESARWLSEIFTGKRTSSIRTDKAGNAIRPDYISTHFHFTALQARSFTQREIVAPPRAGKKSYAYVITVSARNGETKYRYHFVPKDPSIGTPLGFDDFYTAYKILRPEPVTLSDGKIGFKNKVIEEYHDPMFPTSADGAIDYGPNLISIAE
jgi:hypothetical protein